MKNQAQKSKIIALILVMIMMLSTFIGCVPQGNNGDSSPSDGEAGNNNQADNSTTDGNGGTTDDETPDTHICKFGDWVVIKNHTTDTDGLQERKCECGKLEKMVIPAYGTDFCIYYN